jgi:hypothetical protein
MKKMYHTIFISTVVMLLTTVNTVQAQPLRPLQARQGERVEALKVAFFTKQLELSPDEAKAFWPLFDEYSKTVVKHRKEKKVSMEQIAERGIENLTDDELNELIDSRIRQAEENIQARTTFFREVRKVLPPRKVIKFYKAEEQFNKMLLKKAAEMRESKIE